MKREEVVTHIDIPFPENCGECPLLYEEGDYLTCCATKISGGYKFNPTKEKLPYCPLSKWKRLIEIPEDKNKYIIDNTFIRR